VADGTERAWVDSMAEAYDRWLVPTLFEPFAQDLARRIGALAPTRVLELAAGSGVLTRHLADFVPGATVTATDVNDAMVDVGRKRAPAATWRQADASTLPFGDGQFDVVACQFGVMFVPDKAAAFAEARRVLHPTGRFVFNAWAPIETHDFARALDEGLRLAFPDDPPRFISAIPHGYSDLEVISRDLLAGGFEGVESESVTLVGQAASARDVAAGFCKGSPIRAEIAARGDFDAAFAIVVRAMEERLGTGPVTGRMLAHVIEASTGS
jgi:ubiquinone/menaquinone biosynthesis C-methylase UbiE